jgi:8-oxo-dGTP diphosphatase
MDLLIQLDEFQENVSHRPAKLFMFDETRYKQLREDGFVFDI